MEKIAEFPYFRIQFSKDGEVDKAKQREDILKNIPAGTTDVFVVSHGWNNDAPTAQNLYERLFARIRAALPSSPAKDRKFAVVGIFWPSKQFGEESFAEGGAKSAAGGKQAEAKKRLDDLAKLIGNAKDPDIKRAKDALATIDDPASQKQYIEALRAVITKDAGKPTKKEHSEDAADVFFKDKPADIFEALKARTSVTAASVKPTGTGGVKSIGGVKKPGGGGAQSLGSLVRDAVDRASDIANFTTYYIMKKRAGTVGVSGVGPLINDIRKTYPGVRIHTIGHSFGARVVTAASDSMTAAGAIASMSLLQGAYSHNGLGDNKKGLVGFFRKVVTGKRVKGPIVITHTVNDKAVGIAYPIASRLARDNAKALGDRDDQFGGMGRNGALFADATDQTLAAGAKTFKFEAGKIYNLQADAVIKDHSDIDKAEVASAILHAVATG